MKDAYFIGLDLGLVSDYTALTVVKRACEDKTERRAVHRRGLLAGYETRPVSLLKEYQLQHLKRFPLGTPYREIAEGVRQLQLTPQLQQRKCYVVADTTGVGGAVFEQLEDAGVKPLHGISIHGGDSVSRDGRIRRVPKRDLVSTLQVLLQNRTLRFAKGLAEAGVLQKELQNFKVKINISTGHDSYEAWRDGDHDDLVLSLAMACWFAENAAPEDWTGVEGFYG